MEILNILLGIVIGAAAAGAFYFIKWKSSVSQAQFDEVNNQLNSLRIDLSRWEERHRSLEENYKKSCDDLTVERQKVFELNSVSSSLKEINKNLEQRLSEQKVELEEIHQKLNKDFEILANKILEEKSLKFTNQNKENLDTLLNPLNEKIKNFEKKVEEVYVNDTRERAALIQQIKNLHELNQQMSKDANNLTKALKGDTKAQGSWGEFILESVLEKSGLTKGREYQIQESIRTEDGTQLRPDVIIYLPDAKHIIVDSKVSLVAYEQCISCDDEDERMIYLKDHIRSIKNHIKGLGAKNYQNLYQSGSPDFVLMFIAIEPAFAMAVANDANLFYEAFEKNIVIVSPSTMLATLRTIANIWKQEKQTRNAMEIAKQGGALYDKFQGLISDLIDVGNKMRTTQKSYEDAMSKLHTGKGNIIGSIEKLKVLGAKTTKALPQSLLDRIEDPEEQDV